MVLPTIRGGGAGERSAGGEGREVGQRGRLEGETDEQAGKGYNRFSDGVARRGSLVGEQILHKTSRRLCGGRGLGHNGLERYYCTVREKMKIKKVASSSGSFAKCFSLPIARSFPA
jgi:hypothetical protein